MKSLFSKRHLFTVVFSVFLSVFTVVLVTYGASVMDTASVGSGTSSPGAALGVHGGAVVEDFVYSSSLVATSTLTVTSSGATGATSTIRYGFVVATTSLAVDGMSGAVTIGTTTVPNADIPNTQAVDPAFTVSGVGAANNATGTLYVTGGGTSGGQIILKATDRMCISIMANSAGNALDVSAKTAVDLLTTKVVACPR